MFIVYRSEGNTGEPTVSPRIASGHVMPRQTTDSNVTVLSSSKVTDDRFYVDFHCMSCREWNNGGGKVDVTSSDASFYFALGPDGTLESDDLNVQINQHPDIPTLFGLDLKSATGTNGVPTIGSTGDQDSDSDGTDDYGPGFTSRGLAAHAFVMGLAFTIIYPLGYLLLRLFERVWLHWAVQSFGVFLTILGVGSGIAVSIKNDIVSSTWYFPSASY